jgi:hypothetical protein
MCCVKNRPKSAITAREARNKEEEGKLFPNFYTTTGWSIGIVGGGVQLDPLGTATTISPIVPSLGD